MDSALDFYPEPVGSSPIGAVKLLKHTPCRSTLVPRSRMFFFLVFKTMRTSLNQNKSIITRDRSLFTGRGWPEILRGPFFLASRRWGALIFGKKIYKKPAKPIFLRVSDKNKTKKIFRKIFLGGPLFLAVSKIKISAPPCP